MSAPRAAAESATARRSVPSAAAGGVNSVLRDGEHVGPDRADVAVEEGGERSLDEAARASVEIADADLLGVECGVVEESVDHVA